MCYGIGMGGWVDLDGCERVPYGPCTLSQVGKSRWIRFLRFLFFFFFLRKWFIRDVGQSVLSALKHYESTTYECYT